MRKFLCSFILLSFSLIGNAQLFSTRSASVSFYSSTPLEDIKAKSSDVESKLLSTTGQLTFMLLVKSFRFDNEMMEEHFNESYLESDKFPKADFKGAVNNISSVNFNRDGVYPTTVQGNLTIHGITKAVTTNGTIVIKNGKPTAKCTFPIKVRDYNISGKIIGKELAESIAITVDCRYE
ncbi:MAG: YceI family protein [Chitinophagaceae bacterium]|nr:YceI family protein [Chitinophagaceae bacterium]